MRMSTLMLRLSERRAFGCIRAREYLEPCGDRPVTSKRSAQANIVVVAAPEIVEELASL